MINEMDNYPIFNSPTSIYKVNGFSIQELLSQFWEKIQNCIEDVNIAMEFVTWLKETGLPEETRKELELMYEDGRLTAIIDKMAGDLEKSVNDLSNSVNEKIEIINDNLIIIDEKVEFNTNAINELNQKDKELEGKIILLDEEKQNIEDKNLLTKSRNIVGSINELYEDKQNSNDEKLNTINKNVTNAINEVNLKTSEMKTPLPIRIKPNLSSGLTEFDSSVENIITVTNEGFVTYSFCISGGKQNNNIANGVTICTLPSNVPINGIVYGTALLENTSGVVRTGMVAINGNNRQISVYFDTDKSAVSSIRGTVSWFAQFP